MARELPSGLVTFLLTDIEGSTRLLQAVGEDEYADLQDIHRAVLREAFAAHGGVELRTEGDSFVVAFARADEGAHAALAGQRGLVDYDWPGAHAIRVRMGLDTGAATPRGGEYTALVVNQAARITAVAHGGQVLISAATRRALERLPAGATDRSLGRHRLKDLAAAIELFQLSTPDLQSEFPPLRSLESVKHNLPIQISSFIGRDIERAEVAKSLRAARLVSLVGPGGTGKTRLAYQVAADTLDDYPDGVWVARLSPVRNADEVPVTLLAAVGAREEPGRAPTDTVIDELQAARALVILDNCEHLAHAACELADALLTRCGDVRILVTTREPLRLAGEATYHVPGLAIPSSQLPQDVTDLGSSDSVRLFVARAVDVLPTFALTMANGDAITAICRRLDGLPLAIELAASRVSTLSPDVINQRLAGTLDLLQKGGRTAEARQATMRGTIGWSHELLDERECILFRRLAIFVGGWRLDAAEVVCGVDPLAPEDVLDVLDALVDKSLVAVGEDDDGEIRYRLLQTIHAFALEQLMRAGEAEALGRLHASWCFDIAQERPERTHGGADEARWYDRLTMEHPNLLSSLSFLNATGDEDELELADRLAAFWVGRGLWRVARERLAAALHRHSGLTAARGTVAGDLGTVLFSLGEYSDAATHYEEALAIARATGNRNDESRWLGSAGTVAFSRGDYATAGAHFEAAAAIAHEIGDRAKEGHWLAHVGLVAFGRGDLVEARQRLEEGLAIARELGDRGTEGHWLVNLGTVAVSCGDYVGARAHYRDALAIARELSDRRSEASALGGLSGIALKLGAYDDARASYEEALRIAREIGDRWAEGRWRGGLGALAVIEADFEDASRHYEAALTIALDIGDRRSEGAWLAGLGDVKIRVGDLEGAQDHFDGALAVAREIGDRKGQSAALTGLGRVALVGGSPVRARDTLREAMTIAQEIDDRSRLMVIADVVADLLHGVGEHRAAAALLGSVDAARAQTSEPRDGADANRVERMAADARAWIGDHAFDEAWQSGAARTIRGAIDQAFASLQS